MERQSKDELPDLIHVGLMRIASQISARRSGRVISVQMELFEEYKVKKTLTITVEVETGIHKRHKAVGSMTTPEVRTYVSEEANPASDDRVRLTS
jgi:hypothetical protein